MAVPDSSSATPWRGAGQLPVHSAEQVLEALPWGVLVVDADESVAYLNAAAAALWGVPATDIVGRQPVHVEPAVLPPAVVQALRQAPTEPIDCWLPYTQQWISLRTTPTPEGQHWVFWDNVTAHEQAFLLQLSDALRAEPTADAVANRALHLVSELLGLDRCYIAEYHLEADHADIPYQVGNERVPPLPAGGIRLSDFPEAFRVVFDRTLVIDDSAEATDLSDTDRRNIGALGLRALVAATLRRGEHRPHWVLVAVSAAPRRWTPGHIALLEEVAERAWAAVERVRVEEALRDSEATLAAVLDALPVGIGLTTTDGRLTLANHQMRRYLPTGIMPSRDATQLPRWHAVGPDGRPLPPTEFPGARAQRGERVVPGLEMLHTPAEGPPVWTQVFAVPMRYRQDQVAGHVTVILDIDARKRAEDALRQSEEKFRTLFESIDEGFCLVELLTDAQGAAVDFHFLEVNPVFARQTGLVEARGRLLSELAPGTEQPWFDMHGQVVRTGQPVRFEQYHADTGRWYEVYSSRVGGPGSQQLALVFSDITERKQREQQQQFLIKFSDTLRAESDADALANRAVRMLAEHLRLDRCYIGIALLDDNRGIFPYQFGNDRVAPMPEGGVRLSDFPEALRKTFGETLVITDFQHTEGLTKTEKQNFAVLGFGALVVANVRKEEKKPHWSINAVSATPRRWTDVEIRLIEEVTERTWAAVERAKAEEALRTSEERYRSLFDTMSEGVAINELVRDDAGQVVDARYLTLNAAYEAQTGFDASAAIGRRASEVFPAHYRDWLTIMERVVREGRAERFEQFVPDNGQWYTFAAVPFGGPDGFAVFYDNITERKRREADAALLVAISSDLNLLSGESEMLAAVGVHLMRHLQLAGWHYADVDEARGEVMLRHFWHEQEVPPILGTYPIAEFLEPGVVADLRAGKPAVVADVLADIPAGSAANRTLQAGAAAQQIGAYIVVPYSVGGSWKAYFAVADSRPRPWTGAELALVQDVAVRVFPRIERARAEAALAASEEKYRTLFESIDEGFLVHEIVRNEAGQATNFRLLEVNPAFTRQTGLGPDVVGKLGTEFLPNLEPFWLDTYERVVRTGVPERVENYHQATKRWYNVHVSRVGGQEHHVAVVFRDVTERKYREQEQAFLLLLSDALRADPDAEAIGTRATRLVADFLRVDRCYIVRFARDRELGWIGPEYRAAGLPALSGEYRFADFPESMRRIETGPLVIRDLLNDPSLSDTDKHSFAQTMGVQGLLAAVLRQGEGNYFWCLSVATTQPRNWTVAELKLLENVAERTWAAIERAKAEEVLRAAEERHRGQLEQQVAERTRELQQSRDLLQTVFDTNLIAMSVMEAVRDATGTIQDFRLVLVSQELERETGRTDLEGKRYAQEYPGIRDVGIFDLIVRTVETGEPHGMEYFYPHDGFDKWFACQFVKLGDGVVATNLDITARKQAEDERFKNLQLLQQAESLVGFGSWEYDLHTEQFAWSAGMYHLFDIPQNQPVQLGLIFNFVTDESRPQAEYIKYCISTGACDIKETVQVHVHGQPRTIRIRAVVMRDEQGQPLKVLGMNLDISELKRLEADNLHLRLTQQRALFEAVQDAQEAERRRIAEGLHNGVGQLLYATKLQLAQVQADDPALKRTAELLTKAIRQTRAISHELVPMVLNEFGLETALTDICRMLTSSQLRFTCDINVAELAYPLSASLQLAVYRMAQELTQNVVKHAHATEATLTLETVPGFLLLRVEDNGVGFPAALSERAGLGLRSIRDRVALLGGTVDIGSGSQVGTFVRLRLPLSDI